MPNISLTLPEVNQSITRPITFDIINQVLDITKISKEIKIFFPGDTNYMATPGTELGSTDPGYAQFGTGRYMYIELEEDYDKETLGSTAVSAKEHPAVFLDKALGIRIAPVYAATNIRINFRYRCFSKSEALRWRDDLRMRLSQLRDINLHDVTYHYALPLELVMLMKTVYERREAFLGYGQTFPEYFTSHASERLTLIGDLIAQDTRLAISETQADIVGIFDFDVLPEKAAYESENGTWETSFSYKFTYEKPIGCNAKYPIMVHNQMLPEIYIDFTDSGYTRDRTQLTYSSSLGALSGFESDTVTNSRRSPMPFIRLPEYDDYTIPAVPIGTGTVFIALMEVDITDQITLFNLNELGTIMLNQDVLNFISTSEYPYICNLYQSIIHVSLYRNDNLTAATNLICDANLNIKAKAPLDLRNQYRIRLSLVVDLTLLNRNAIERLRRNPKALTVIIGAMNELLRNHPDFVNLGDKKQLTMAEFSAIYAILTGYGYDNGTGTFGHQYYGDGLRIASWSCRGSGGGSLFGDLDKNIIENYRKNRIGMNTVQITGVCALKKEQ